MSCDAVVARAERNGLEYLVCRRDQLMWIRVQTDAQIFQSMREATRASVVLPARLRAFALPRVAHDN
jgi:hypothetical protein